VPDDTTTNESVIAGKSRYGENEDEGGKQVYTLSNQVSGNAVMEYTRAADGTLSFNTSYPTGGTGTGGGLGNQYAIILGDDEGKVLLAVNAGSNTVSSFKVTEKGLQLKSTVASGGVRPVSITMHEDIVFVLNAGGAGNIAGFRLSGDDRLNPVANSTRPLSAMGANAAEIAFVNNGRVVVITERVTNKIITYTVNEDGIPGTMHSITSATPTPFGFDAGKNGNIFVS
jgi:6-phosphogluconolactonase